MLSMVKLTSSPFLIGNTVYVCVCVVCVCGVCVCGVCVCRTHKIYFQQISYVL